MGVIKGINISIHADGAPLEEREDTSIDEGDVSRITRYIQAQSGQLFEIHMVTPAEDRFEGNILSYDIYADSRLLDSVLIQKGSPLAIEESKGLLLPEGTIRLFRFADLAIAEHDPGSGARKDGEEHKDVGKIVIKVHHKNRGETSTIYSHPEGWKGVDVVDEKTLKGQAVSHSVGLAPAIQAEGNVVHCQTSFVDPERVPLAVFTFLYRSAKNLASIFIPTPTASPEPEQTTASMRARIQELERQLQEYRPAGELILGIKRERTENETIDGPLRQSRRQRLTRYMEFRDDDDEALEEIEAPVRTIQPSTQLD